MSDVARAGSKRPRVLPSQIANKIKRSEVYNKLRIAKKAEQSAARRARVAARKATNTAAQVPKTLDSTREVEATYVREDEEEVLRDEMEDEFAAFFTAGEVPKIMITTRPKPSAKVFPLISDLMMVLPNSFYYKRFKLPLKKICVWAAARGFTHVCVLNEKSKVPNGLLVVRVPTGPTAYFRLSSSMHARDVPNHGSATTHTPEIALRGFTTRLGRRVGRILGSLFPHKPDFEGRRVCTFHNQRDFIFFRQHRYMFTPDGKGVKLQELGPRFTLKLKWILAGTFDTVYGEYEFYHKRHELETSRRRFLL